MSKLASAIALKLLFASLILSLCCSTESWANDDSEGIHVGPALLFSERALASMLEASRDALEKADPEFAKSRDNLGKVQGLRASVRSSALDLSYKPTISVVETIKDSDGVDAGDKRAVTSSIEKVSTEKSELAIPAISITNSYGPTGSSDGGFSPSSIDSLAERTALFYRFINLRYLFTQSTSQMIDKRPAFIGFDISIEPSLKNRNQAAEVVISCTPKAPKKDDENENKEGATTQSREIELAQILPLRETYNVLGAVESTKNLGLGLVLGPISFGWRNATSDKQMYLVQDVDTVSFQKSDSGFLSFGWTFRPVLGRQWLSPGTRRVYALLAIPSSYKEGQMTFQVSTRWVDVEPSSGVLKGTGSSKKLFERGLRLWQLSTAKPSVSKDLLQTTVKVSDEIVEVPVLGRNFTPAMTVSLGGEIISNFRIEDYRGCECGSPAAHAQHAQKLVIFAPKRLVSNGNSLSIDNEWGVYSSELKSVVTIDKPSVGEASNVKIVILSRKSAPHSVPGSTGSKAKSEKKATEEPKTAIAVKGSGLTGGCLVVSGQVFPASSAKLADDKYLLFEVNAEGGTNDVAFMDASGNLFHVVEDLAKPKQQRSRK